MLVVEDNPFNMELVTEALSTQGLTVDGAVDGKEAIKKAESQIYDLILMDIALPGMDGIEVTKLVKKKPEYKDVPVVALTAYALKEDRGRFLEAGFDDYVSKPIDMPEFMKRIEKYRIKWYEKTKFSVKKKDWIRTTGLSLLDDAIGGGLFSGSVVYILADPAINAQVFLFHFAQPRKTFYFTTEREPKYINQEIKTFGFEISSIEFVDVFSAYRSAASETMGTGTEITDRKLLEYVKKRLEGIKEKDITIIIDTFNFFPTLNVGRNSIKELMNVIYQFAKTNDAIVYLLSLRDTIDQKIENEIMWQCDVIFDIKLGRMGDKITNELMITKARNVDVVSDILKFFIRGKIVIDSSKEIA